MVRSMVLRICRLVWWMVWRLVWLETILLILLRLGMARTLLSVYGGGGGSKYYGTGRAGTANHGSVSYGRPASAFGSGRSISSGIANRDRTNSVITRSGTSNRFNSNRNVSYQRNNINTSSSRNQSYNNSSSTRGSSISSGGSFGGGSRGGGGISAGGSRSGGSIGHGGRR